MINISESHCEKPGQDKPTKSCSRELCRIVEHIYNMSVEDILCGTGTQVISTK